MARAVEDLIEHLGAETALPAASRAKLAERRDLRARLQA
jgi:hypothetical protein